MIDHFPAEKLLEHFLEFVKKVKLEFNFRFSVILNLQLKFFAIIKQNLIYSPRLIKLFLIILQVKDDLAVADELIVEGNDDLKNCLLQKNGTRNELQWAQCKIEATILYMACRQSLEGTA